MAAPLVAAATMSFNKLAVGANLRVLVATTPLFQQSCGKRTKTGSTTKNMGGGKARGKRRRPYQQNGTFAYKGEILVRQYGLTFYPGENVGIQKNNTLFALRDGTVVVTCEKLSPYPDSPLYERVKKGMTIHKKFWNIYPTPVHAKFKLISES